MSGCHSGEDEGWGGSESNSWRDKEWVGGQFMEGRLGVMGLKGAGAGG